MIRIGPPVLAGDRPAARATLLVFALVAAANVTAMSGAKAATIVVLRSDALPWMYLLSSAFTAALALGWARVVRPRRATFQLIGLALSGAVAMLLLAVGQRQGNPFAAMIGFPWTAAVSQLLVIQSASWCGSLLEPRQFARLFPALSVASTTGAVVGGALTRVSLAAGGLAQAPFLVATVALVGAAIAAAWGVRQLPAREEARPGAAPRVELGRIFTSFRRVPLLRHLLFLTLAGQAANLLLDFQLSTALKSELASVEIAQLLGLYYAVANMGILLFWGLAGGQLDRRLGIGTAVAAPAWVLGATALATVVVTAVTGRAGLYVLLLGSLLERIVDFSIARGAVQAALSPVEPALAEPARFFLGGFAGRLAVFVVSGALLLLPSESHGAALPAVLACVALLAIVPGILLTRSHQAAIEQAVGSRFSAGDAVPGWMRHHWTRVLVRQLGHPDPAKVKGALALFGTLGAEVPPSAWRGLLDNKRPASVLIAAMGAGPVALPELRAMVQILADNTDPVVSGAARAWLARADTGRTRATAPQGDSIDALLLALEHRDARSDAITALALLPEATLLPAVGRRLDGGALSWAQASSVLRLLELSSGAQATSLLIQACAQGDTVRTRAILALWRRALKRPDDLPPATFITAEAARETQHLLVLSLAESMLERKLGRAGTPMRTELALRRRLAESLGIKLIGLHAGARHTEPALVAFANGDAWQRAHAIELLEGVAGKSALRSLILVIEASDVRGDHMVTVGTRVFGVAEYVELGTRVGPGAPPEAVRTELTTLDPLLGELWSWTFRKETCVEPTDRDRLLDHVLALGAVPLFANVTAAQLLPLATVARERTFAAGEVMFRQGDTSNALYVILKGEVQVDRDGRMLDVLGENECVGEMGVLDNQPRAATARAVGEVKTLEIAASDFEDLREIAPGLAEGIIRVLVGRVRDMLAQMPRVATSAAGRFRSFGG